MCLWVGTIITCENVNVRLEQCPSAYLNEHINSRAAPHVSNLGGWHCYVHAPSRMDLWCFNSGEKINPVVLFTHFVFYNLSSSLLKRYANCMCVCVCICESQGCVNTQLDTSICQMDTTSLDTVIIVNVQKWCGLTLSQNVPYHSHPLSNYTWMLGTMHPIHHICHAKAELILKKYQL